MFALNAINLETKCPEKEKKKPRRQLCKNKIKKVLISTWKDLKNFETKTGERVFNLCLTRKYIIKPLTKQVYFWHIQFLFAILILCIARI